MNYLLIGELVPGFDTLHILSGSHIRATHTFGHVDVLTHTVKYNPVSGRKTETMMRISLTILQTE